MMSHQRNPAVRQIQPTRLRGRLEAVRAPTTGNARKVTKISRSPALLQSPVPSRVGRGSTESTVVATAMARQSPASDQASHVQARAYALAPPRFRLLVPSATLLLYSTTVSRALRQPLRTSPFLSQGKLRFRRISLEAKRCMLVSLKLGAYFRGGVRTQQCNRPSPRPTP